MMGGWLSCVASLVREALFGNERVSPNGERAVGQASGCVCIDGPWEYGRGTAAVLEGAVLGRQRRLRRCRRCSTIGIVKCLERII